MRAAGNNDIVVKFVCLNTALPLNNGLTLRVTMANSFYTLVADCETFIAIHKAPDVSVHRDDSESGLIERICADLGYDRLYLVHRLDRMTSGLLLLAKDARSCAELAQLFAQRNVEKYYFALSLHKPQKKQGLVRGDMLRGRNGSWLLSREQNDPAVTRFFSRSVQPGLRLFVLRPATGKTHQLRVAMKSLGAAILGDGRYGGESADRGYLHAYALRFEYEGRPFTLCAEPLHGHCFEPGPVRAALREWAEPWTLPWQMENREPAIIKQP